jgi:probable F420-dependent oxidoreductase
MQVGVVFPQTEIGSDPAAVRAYASAVEEQGYRHLLVYDHVVGADPRFYKDWRGPYDLNSNFHEPFVLFGYLAAFSGLELVTGIVILPQRQTVLVAKQAAEVDVLTGGRLRLGVGLGWNAVEYEALGRSFSDRGKRMSEQVELMRRLWTEESVTHAGPSERVTGAGLCPLPVQRPIPVWFGGSSAPAYRRAGALADGWFPQLQPGSELEAAREVVTLAAHEAGRDPASIGMEGRVSLRERGAAAVVEGLEAWRQAGATHASVNTMGAGLTGAEEHIAVLAEVGGALEGLA